jgi:hypothetical protein
MRYILHYTDPGDVVWTLLWHGYPRAAQLGGDRKAVEALAI